MKFNEKDMAVQCYCGTLSESHFDGAAVNNEYFANIKDYDANTEQEHLGFAEINS